MKIIFALTIIGALLVFPVRYGEAQSTSPLLVTWRANAYVPSGFAGKILSPRGGSVTVSVDLLVAGKPADLSNREIRWFVENELLRSGKNLRRITFSLPVQNADAVTVKAVVLGTQQGNIERTISIPVSSPVLVITVPSEGGSIGATAITARAIPYFFSIEKPEELSFAWSANGSPAVGEASDAVTVDANGGISGNSVVLGVRAVNPAAAVESAQSSITLRIK